MKACFPVLCARNRAGFSAYRTHHSRANLTKPRPAWSRSVEQLEQLVGEQGDHANHQVQRDFLGSPDHNVAAPKLFFQAAVEALRHRPFLVPGRLVGRQRDNLPPPAISVDDGNVPQAAAHRVDGLSVISRIHQIIQVIHPFAGLLYQRDGDLAVVQGGRGQRQADGQAAVSDVGVQLEAYPGRLITFGVLFGPHIAVHRQLRQGLRGRLPALALQTRLRFGFSHLPTAGAALFPGRRFGGLRLRRGFLPALNGRGVPADMPHQFRRHPLLHQGRMNPVPQPDLGKFRKGPRKDGLGGDIASPRITADAPQPPRRPQGLPEGAGEGVVINRLGHKGPGQSPAIQSLPAKSLGRPTGKFLNLDQLQDVD
jgi:hypothetical protein